MKVLSYNIYEGAQARGSDQTTAVLNVIQAADPDVVGLCECTGFADNNAATLKKFEEELGMRAVMNRASSGDHVALLYRKNVPIVEENCSSVTMFHGFASIVISLSTIGRVAIIMAHLHPRSSILRLAEAQNILSKATFQENAIVMGDFNSLAKYDQTANLNQLSLNAQARLFDSDRKLTGDVVDLFSTYGFVDLGAATAASTYPTKLFKKDERDGVRLRLDYMFASPAISLIARLSTISTPEAQMASDHLPLLCELTP
jgi:endonuclease/exonuclease/phosphatase family metal-dependent hydrolase